MRRDFRKSGFTLVEVIAASVIGAFVALVAVGTLRTVSAGREKLDANVAAAAEVRFAADMIRRDLGNLYRDRDAGNIKLVGTIEQTAYGPVTRLILHTVNRVKARADEPEGDVYEVEYFLLRREERTVLMRRLWPYPHKESEPGGVMTAIAENISVFEVSYLAGGEWMSEWPEEMKSLPELIEVSLAARPAQQKNIIADTFLVNFARLPRRQTARSETAAGRTE